MNRRQIQLLLIAAAFVLPAVIAILLQTRWFHWDPQTTRNRGQLIEPVIALGDDPANALLADGRRWTVVVRVPAACDAGCARRIALLGRIREAQGKDMERVQMVAWSEGSAPPDPVWTPWQPDAALATRLSLDEGAVMLIDPLGNAMMRYRVEADPTDVRKDVAHLLRWSKLGK